jgi:pyruvate dehydrogenase E1 component beta subunit
VGKTGHLVVAHEAVQFGGLGGEIAAQVAERALDSLKRAPVRVGAPFVPIPYSEPMELRVIPQIADIVEGVRRCLR